MAEQTPTTLEGWRAYAVTTLSEAKEKCHRTWSEMLNYQTGHTDDQPDIRFGLSLELSALEHADLALRRVIEELRQGQARHRQLE